MTKKYVTPEMKVVNMETAPLLAGSQVTGTGESGKWSRARMFDDDED